MSPRLKTPLEIHQIGIRGMRDSLDPQTVGRDRASLLQNVYPQDSAAGGSVVGRPGFTVMDTQLASGAETQLIIQFTKLNGTELTVGFAGGNMYTYNWGTDTWAQVTLVGVSLPASGRIFAVEFADQLIVNPNDGTNKPWAWDGATTFTSLTNAPLAYGKPVVYYGKLFFIVWGTRNEIQWSEEAAPNTGYTAGGFNNAWVLRQVEQEALFALYATNEALYYFRARSTGAIRGAVTPDFESTGTREGISETVGTLAPDGVCGHDRDIYFIDPDGKPHVLRPGIGVEDQVWRDFAETIKGLPKANVGQAVAVNHRALDQVLFGVVGPGGSILTKTMAVAYDGGDVRAAAVYAGYTFTCAGIVKDGAGRPTLAHGSSDGHFYRHGRPDGPLWNDELAAGDAPIEHVLIGGFLGYDTKYQKHFERLDLSLALLTVLTALELEYLTPYETKALGTFPAISGGFSIWDAFVWDTDTWSVSGLERHIFAGLDAFGRWVRLKLRHAVLGERFGVNAFTLTAVPAAPEPEAF